MDIGSLVVDLASLVIVISVLTIVVVRADTSAPDEQRAASDDVEEFGYFGPNPLEADELAVRES